MRKRSHIRAVIGEESTLATHGSEPPEDISESDFETVDEWQEYELEGERSGFWILPTLAALAILSWTAFFGWSNRLEMSAGAPNQQWIDWIGAWSLPVLLVVALWILAMRSSTREAHRFGRTANMLSRESRNLEERLAIVNRELSLAREFLAAQTRELEFLGRTATERLSEHADRLQHLVIENGAQVDGIATVSSTALENMNRLRDSLPVITNSARDVANQIGTAGRTAQDNVAELAAGLERLNEFGLASERQVSVLRHRVDETIGKLEERLDQIGTAAEARLVTLRNENENFRAEIEGREVEALAAIRARAEAMRGELVNTHAACLAQQADGHSAIRDNLAALEAEASAVADDLRNSQADALAAWDRQVRAMQEKLALAAEEIEAIEARTHESASRRLAEISAEAAALDRNLAERHARFDEEIAQRLSEIDRTEEATAAQLGERLASLDDAIARRRDEHLVQMERFAVQSEAIGAQIAELEAQMANAAGQGREAQGALAAGVTALESKLAETREALDGTDMAVAALTDSSVRLLELIQASARQSREDLPAAMEASEARLVVVERRSEGIRTLLEEARSSGESLSNWIGAADTKSREAMAQIDGFRTQFDGLTQAQEAGIERLRTGIAALGDESREVALRAQEELRAAITALEESARNAVGSIENNHSEMIRQISQKIGTESAEAIGTAVTEHSEAALTNLEAAVARSAEAGRQVAIQLRNQLARLNELTTNLESRVSQARERAEQQVDHDFSRRVALITESLNSNAIDIAKALSTEVTDMAWTSYLRGDRGIFTRRAVRLLDNAEAREIAQLYDADAEFREHVSRYIHDFEAMLRTILSTRDGNAVSVTLLSSDMGKLYVVLAQAIDRLRQ